jgi:hypothetical protein
VTEYESGRPVYDSELARLTDEWKQLQKKNAQRKATLQMSTGIMINDEEDCSRVLDQQTQNIQELRQKQKVLEVPASAALRDLLMEAVELIRCSVFGSCCVGRIKALISRPGSSRRPRGSTSSPSRLDHCPAARIWCMRSDTCDLCCRTMRAARMSR